MYQWHLADSYKLKILETSGAHLAFTPGFQGEWFWSQGWMAMCQGWRYTTEYQFFLHNTRNHFDHPLPHETKHDSASLTKNVLALLFTRELLGNGITPWGDYIEQVPNGLQPVGTAINGLEHVVLGPMVGDWDQWRGGIRQSQTMTQDTTNDRKQMDKKGTQTWSTTIMTTTKH